MRNRSERPDRGIERWYNVVLRATTFSADPEHREEYSHTENFESADLHKARSAAFSYYHSACEGVEREGRFFLPYASPNAFEKGCHAAYSAVLSLVEAREDEERYHELLGAGEEAMMQTFLRECKIFGWNDPAAAKRLFLNWSKPERLWTPGQLSKVYGEENRAKKFSTKGLYIPNDDIPFV